jgi:uncharacterized protein Yka (UPF0111/DUF47 family)
MPSAPAVDEAMTLKREIVSELGEAELLLPDQIARALIANDQIKYYLALLQTARQNADRPRVPAPDLKVERLACQLGHAWLDDVVGNAKKDRGSGYHIPHGPEILRRTWAGVETMLACLPEPKRLKLGARLKRLGMPQMNDGAIAGEHIDAMTSGDRKQGDSLHLLVMDAHRAINELQAETADDTLAGARVHSLSPRGRKLVQAFMAGLNRTAPLKFDHPGLGTTATEHCGQVLIQNDIGTTDAHVLVIRAQDHVTTLTYTDIHRQRLKFFQRLLGSFAVTWEQADLRTSDKLESGNYLLTTGIYHAADEADLERYLEHLGSRIVFLIDWNRARKRLRGFVDNAHAIEVLGWAADSDLGHRGLLEIGGEKALAEAVEYAADDRLRYGDRLDELIGAENACLFLRNAIKAASIGLRQRRSRRTILDEIKADLRRYFDRARLQIFDLAARHAAIGYDLAVTIRETLQATPDGGVEPMAKRAALWEANADRLLNLARDDVRRFERPQSLLQFIEYADDAVDEMEEAAALLDLAQVLPFQAPTLQGLRSISELVLASAQELVKCVECAATITRGDVRDDIDDFLQCLEELIDIEHRADAQTRALQHAAITGNLDHRGLYLAHRLSGTLESTTDAHMHAAHALRGYLMDEVLA